MRAFKFIHPNQSGFTLIESLVAVAIVGFIAVFFVNSLGTSTSLGASIDEDETAKNLAEYQMEYIKNQAYMVSYEPAPIPEAYSNYTANITTSMVNLRDGNIQKITVKIVHHGINVTSLEGYKLN
ncbi:MAG: type II secretion system protein [Dehalococcoidales bacterium]|nr:type II secretion system protein [Dehalococcoidales bacterium]